MSARMSYVAAKQRLEDIGVVFGVAYTSETPRVSSTHRESVGGEGYVTIQHCEVCDEYLGVNYPSEFCDDHRPKVKKSKASKSQLRREARNV